MRESMPAPLAASFEKPCRETAVEELCLDSHSSGSTFKSQKDKIFFLFEYRSKDSDLSLQIFFGISNLSKCKRGSIIMQAGRLIWVSGLCSSPFATIARYPYNKYYHVFSALVESSTLAPLIIVYKHPRKLRLKNFYYILLDCFLAVLDVHVKYK